MIKQSLLAQRCSEDLGITEKLIMESTFQIFAEGVLYECVSAKLFKNHILFSLKNRYNEGQKEEEEEHGLKTCTYIIRFSFDLCFQMLRPLQKNNKHWNLGDCYAVRFDRDEKYLELRNPEAPGALAAWRQNLKGSLNQRGFHEQFTAQKEIGEGHFAKVFRIVSHEDKKLYATKAFNKQVSYADENGKESLINEIEVMRNFDHPNLMKMFGVYESKNSLYIVVELLTGQLYDKINQVHKFYLPQSRKIMKSILNGLSALHIKGYMHRDLKPENILFKKENSSQCVIADFGLVENIDSKKLMFARCGTPGYVAPEIVNLSDSKVRYGCKCDMFSLGVIFHILLLGKSPFDGTTNKEVLMENKICSINYQAQSYQRLSQFQMDFLKKMLQKDPAKRISAEEALKHDYFSKEPDHKEEMEEDVVVQKVDLDVKPKKKPKVTRGKKVSQQNECQSPIMLTKNLERKKEGILESNNDIKFKMGENMVPVIQESNCFVGIQSPGALGIEAMDPNQVDFAKAETFWGNQ